VHLIAEGGMASVYLATQESLGRYVALKLLKKFDNATQSKRFLIEGQILAALNHHNIITIYDIGVTDDERPYISMEYLEGGDLEARIEKGMTPQDALNVVEAISDCLSLVHREGIIHRDIKPANILFHKDGTPVLSDFGIAKQEESDARLTMEGSAFGSPYYLSPEQAESKTLDGRADIYGLGIVLYEMLTGNKPYKGNSHIETIVAHLSDPLPILPLDLNQYQDLVHKMIAKSPADRFSNAGEIVEYIRRFREPETDTLGPVVDKKLSTSLNNTQDVQQLRKPLHHQALSTDGQQNSSMTGNEKILWTLAGILALVLTISGTYIWMQQQATIVSNEYTGESEPAIYDAVNIDDVDDVESTVDIEKPDKTDIALTQPQKPESFARSKSVTSGNQAQRIKNYMSKASLALNEFRLALPKEHNAYYYYQQVLDIQPNHKGAIKGIIKIANAYADLAEKELNRFNYPKANRYIRMGLEIQPNNSRLLKLQRDTNVLQGTSKALEDTSKWVFDKIKSIFK
jgi:serine/threonine-protein kinase PpkA